MDPRRLAIACLLLTGCGTSPDVRYQKGRLLLKQGKIKDAMVEADQGFSAEPSWRFRILKADLLLARSDIKGAKALLDSPTLPSDGESLARLRMAQAYAEYLTSDYSASTKSLDQAAAAAKPLDLPVLDAMIENRAGLVSVRQGRLDLAEQSFRHVIGVAAAQHDPYLESTATANLGFLFENAFRFEDAIYWFEKASAKFRELGNLNSYYVTIGNLGTCYLRLGDLDKGIQDLQQAADHARQIPDYFSEQLWIGNSGSVLYDRGDLPRAAEKFKQALDIAQAHDKTEKDLSGWWYYSLASVSIDLGKLDEAEAYNKEALVRRQAVGDHTDFYPRVNEAHIAAGRKEARAEALYRGLIAEYREGMNPVPMLEAQAGLAALLADRGELELADAQFRATLSYLESQRAALARADNRMTYLAKLIRFYDRYINFLVDRGQPERALEVAESSRARVLDERLESKPHAPVQAARMRDLARRSHSVFLSYWLGKNRSFLWAVNAEGITLHTLPAESQIAPLVAVYRSFIENLRDPLQSEYQAGPKLSGMLLGPVRPLLTSSQKIVLVPDRSLHSLNFETLPDPDNPSRYFIERATVELAPSLDILAESRPPVSTADSLLLIGDPLQAIEEYPRLPYAAAEIEVISKTFPPEKQVVLQGADANPDAYRDALPGAASRIHFAAHAAANQGSPLDSALILSRHGAAYQLSARDVMNIPLNASLVTLSACRSAGAKTYSGEGQVGLSWAFLRAGARSVVAGLWDVTDRSTASLMADFYRQLSQKVPPAEALRHAKLSLLHAGNVYQKPFYWGPFQLYAGTI